MLPKSKKYKIKDFVRLFLLFFIFLLFRSQLPALDLQGDFVQGGIAYGKVENSTKVFIDSKRIPVYEDGTFVIGFYRKNNEISTLKLVYENGNILEKKMNIKKRIYKVQKINKLDNKKVTPPESFLNRIKEEAQLVKKSKKKFYDFPFFKVGFMMPTNGVITGVYGSQRILNGTPKRPHYGIDIANKKGTVVYAPSDGIIVLSERNLYFSGGTIIISHGMAMTSSLLHLSEIFVKVGEKVKKGDKIGLMGSTGRSTGPHLDWRMEVGGIRVDPEIVLNLRNNIY